MKAKKFIISLIIVAVIVLADQITKLLIVNNYNLKDEKQIIGDFLVLTYIRNSGAAWGSFAGKTAILVIFSIIVFIFIFRSYIRILEDPKYKPIRICYLCVVGGAIGNMIDRIRLHYVIDFIYFKFIDFPVFNIADIFVTLSVIVLVILFIFKYKDEDYEIIF